MISLNRSSLQPKLLQCLEKLVYGLSIDDKSGDLGWTLAYFSGSTIFLQRISRILFLGAWENLGMLGSGNQNLFPKFRELWSRGPVILCGNMHQSLTDKLVKWFFDNLFAESFSVLPVDCIAWRLAANFLYKCPTSRGGSLWQHSLLVFIWK